MTDEIVLFDVYQSRQPQHRPDLRPVKAPTAIAQSTTTSVELRILSQPPKAPRGSMGPSVKKLPNRLQVYAKPTESSKEPASSVSSSSTSSAHSGSSGHNRSKKSSGRTTPAVERLIATPLDTVVRVPGQDGFSHTCRTLNKKCYDFLSSKALVIQTFVILAILCVPCNVVTFLVVRRVSQYPSDPTSWMYGRTYSPTKTNILSHLDQPETDVCSMPLNISQVVVHVRSKNGSLMTSANNALTQKITTTFMDRLMDSFCDSSHQNANDMEHLVMSCFSSSSGNNSTILKLAERERLDRETREEIKEEICDNHNQSSADTLNETSSAKPESERRLLVVRCISTVFYKQFQTKKSRAHKAKKNFTCYEAFKTHRSIVELARRWFDGFGLVLTGFFGLIGNFMTLIVLHRQVSYIESTSNFNKLLMTLALVDSILILFYLVDVAMLVFLCHPPVWYKRLFPHFLFPGKSIVLSCSIYMVVAISAERYKAICYPLRHRHRPSSLQYISFVLFVSLVQNIPKFFEYELTQTDYDATRLTLDDFYHKFTQWWDKLLISGLLPFFCLVFFNLRIYFKIRDSANYRYRFVGNSTFRRRMSQPPTDLSSTGSTNFLRSSGLSSNLPSRKSTVSGYRSPSHLHRSSSKTSGTRQPIKRMRGKSECANDLALALNGDPSDPKVIAADLHAHHKAPGGTACPCDFCSKSHYPCGVHRQRSHSESFFSRNRADRTCRFGGQRKQLIQDTDPLRRGGPDNMSLTLSPTSSGLWRAYCCLVEEPRRDDEEPTYAFSSTNSYLMKVDSIKRGKEHSRESQRPFGANGGERARRSSHRASSKRRWFRTCLHSGSTDPNQGMGDETESVMNAEAGCLSSVAKNCHLSALSEDDIEEVTKKRDIFPLAGALPPQRNSSLHRRTLKRYASGQLHIRRRREKSTLILVAIVVIFLTCHMVRLGLQGYRAINHMTMEHHTYCTIQNRYSVPISMYVLLSLSNLLVVLNSSVNFIVYCLVEESFRKELKNLLKRGLKRLAQLLPCQKKPIVTQDLVPSCH